MMISQTHHHHHNNHHAPPWSDPLSPHPTVQIPSPQSPPSTLSPTNYDAVLSSLRRYLLSSSAGEPDSPPAPAAEFSGDFDLPANIDDDEFYIYEFKIRKCTRARAHDWTECPFAHPGEKARRRDPRKFNYSGAACADFRKGHCKKGDACEHAHGVFECWLHPTRYRTQPCKDGACCNRRVCFFAHTPDQLRAVPSSFGSGSGSGSGTGSVGELAAALRNLQLSKVKSMPTNSWSRSVGVGSPVFGSPRGAVRPGFFSLPTTPTARPGSSEFGVGEEGVVMERVESGRELRARMFEKLSKENPLTGRSDPVHNGPGPDLGWVSDLIQE